jgi:hypothetical protein
VRCVALFTLSLLPFLHSAAADAGNVGICAHGYLACQQACNSQLTQCTSTANDLDYCSSGYLTCRTVCENREHDCWRE